MNNYPSLEYINKLANGDEKFIVRIIETIKTEFPLEKSLYFECLTLGDFYKSAECVHKIKHKFSILSFEVAYNLALKHENNLREDSNSLAKDFELYLDITTKYLSSL